MANQNANNNPRGPGRPRIAPADESAQINLRLTKTQLDWLSDESRRQGQSGRTAVIRRLIDDAMATYGRKR
jgi:hypothetical protein